MEPVTTPDFYYTLPLIIATLKTYGFLGLSGFAFYAGARFVVSKKFTNPFEILAISLVAGPLLASWIFVQILRILPGMDPDVYTRSGHVLALVFGLIGLFFFLRNDVKKTETGYDDPRSWGGFVLERRYLILIGAIALALFLDYARIVSVTALITPFSSNDPMEYAYSGKLIASVRDISIYPFVDAEKTGGFFGAWTHPPGYIGLMTWAYLANDGTAYGARLVSLYFVLSSFLAVWAFGVRRSPIHALFGIVFAVFAPSVYGLGVISHTDPVRIAGLTIAALAIYRLIFAPEWRNVIVCALILGLAQFTHSIGILTGCLVLPAYFICSSGRFLHKTSRIVVMVALSLLVIAPDLYKNWLTFGSFIQDSVPLWNVEGLGIQELRNFNRNLTTLPEKIYFGLLKGFSSPGAFGRSYPLLVFVLLLSAGYLFWREQRTFVMRIVTLAIFKNPQLHIFCLLVIFGFYGMVLLSMAAGTDLIIKNPRYFLTIQFLIAIYTGYVLAEIAMRFFGGERFEVFKELPDNKWVNGIAAFIFFGFTMGAMFYGEYHLRKYRTATYAQFNIIPATMHDNYEQKMLASDSRMYQGVWYLNRLVDGGYFGGNDRVLVFRKAESALYGKFKIRTHYDGDMLGVFTASTIDDVYQILKQKNIRYVLLPPYPQAEVYNSAFGQLISDTRYSQLKFDFQGVKVFEVRPTPLWSGSPSQVTPSGDYKGDVGQVLTLNKDKQRIVATRCPLLGPCENRTAGEFGTRIFDTEWEVFPTSDLRGAFSWGGLHYVGLNTPDNSGEKIVFEPGVYKFNSDIDARGFISVVLFTYPQSVEGADRAVGQRVIWSGLMDGKKTVESQFEIYPPLLNSAEWRKSENKPIEYGFAVELLGQGEATIGDFSVQKIAKELSFIGNRHLMYNEMTSNSWRIETPEIDPVLLVPTSIYGKTTQDLDGEQVRIRSIDSRPLTVTGPRYALHPNDVLDAYGTVAAGTLSNTSIGPLTNVLGYSVKIGFSGQGVIQIGVNYVCRSGEDGSHSFGWYLAEGFEQAIERNFNAECAIASWQPYFRTSQSLFVYGPGYHEADLSFEVQDAKGYLSDRVTIKPIDLKAQTYSNNVNYRTAPSTIKIARPQHADNISAVPPILMEDVPAVSLGGGDASEVPSKALQEVETELNENER